MTTEKINGMTTEKISDPLKIVIVGAGIGGLTAALGLRQEGHHVMLFERSELAVETSAAIHLAPNCLGILRRFGVDPENFGANPVQGLQFYGADGTLRNSIDVRQSLTIWQHPWLLSHRAGLHNELKRLATRADGPGPPAVLNVASRVVTVDTSQAKIVLEDGTEVCGDLVLGADGVGSITREAVVDEDMKPFGSGKSAFRFLVSHDEISKNSETKHLSEQKGYMSMWFGSDRRLIMYPCNNNTIMNFVAIHPSELSASKGGGWDREASKETLLGAYQDFGPMVQALLQMIDVSALKVWTLLDMDRISRWVKGRTALLGDAAHPFLPHQGQGGGVAIEDAGSIAALITAGVSRDEIPARLGLYERIRDERAHKIQEFTRQAGVDINDKNRGRFDIMEFLAYNFGHDEWHNSKHELRKFLWQQDGTLRWRQPLSFGPMPSPRQDHYGRAISSADAHFTTHTVRFKTSRTYLQTLFPSSSFSFSSPGTVAEASFLCTQLDNLKWLGGTGYRFWGLWIHGVQYTKKDGSNLSGSFLPVLFENLCDPIITGRAEVAMPKLFCDIDIAKTPERTTITCSWRGKVFSSMTLENLREVSSETPPTKDATPALDDKGALPPPVPPEDGLLVYRYVPAVGVKGTADAEYAVVFPKADESMPRVVQKKTTSSKGTTTIDRGDWESLPTIHHIASGLSEIPIYSIIEAKTEEGLGVDDLSGGIRIE